MAVYPVHGGLKESGNLATIVNGADDTYYYYTDMSYFEALSFQGAMSCVAGTVTLTVEGTLQDDGTAQGSCTYADVTNAVFGVANVEAAAGAAVVSLFDTSDRLGKFKYVRCKVVANTAGNTGDWAINFLRTRFVK